MKQQFSHDSVSRYIEASPQVLYDLVSDVTNTPKLSEDIVSCAWLDGATERRSDGGCPVQGG